MKSLNLFLLCLCFVVNVSAQNVDDGPYLLYENGKGYVHRVENGVSSRTELEGGQVLVKVPGKKKQDFTVRLKPSHRLEPSVYAQPDRLFFVSDIEGEFAGFRKLLIGAKVMDENYAWTFGRGHLVICGDLFDRGRQVPQVLWLLYHLEQEAERQGGYVHTILGNHDIMNLSGDLRYLDKKYPKSAELMDKNYMDLYTAETELGRWLRSKNTIEKIGDNLCMHAGIAPQIARLGLSIPEINARCRPYYDRAARMKGVGNPEVDVFFSGKTSLFWYRGYFFEPKATGAEVAEVLRVFGGNRLVVGHTIVKGNVGFYYNYRVLGIDVDQHRGDHQGALFEGGRWYKVKKSGKRKLLY